MRRGLLVAGAILFLSILSQISFAQEGSGQGGPNGPGKTFAPENFQETKARVLTMIEQRRTRLDQEKACVEKSSSMEEMKKCRPEPPMGYGGKQQRGGEHRSQMSPQQERQ